MATVKQETQSEITTAEVVNTVLSVRGVLSATGRMDYCLSQLLDITVRKRAVAAFSQVPSATVALTVFSRSRCAARTAMPPVCGAGIRSVRYTFAEETEPVAATSVKQPIPGLILSNTLRAGVAALAKTLSVELAPEGITVNMVAPGPIQGTHMFHEIIPAGSDREAALAAAIPARRLGRPEDVANAVLFFAARESGFVTGQVLYVAGGPKA